MDNSAPTVWHAKPCLFQAIRCLETWHRKHDYGPGEYLLSWPSWPDDPAPRIASEFEALCRPEGSWALPALLRFTPEEAVPTAVYLRGCSPVTFALGLLCAQAAIPWQRALAGKLTETDFQALIRSAGPVAVAPLVICDARPARPIEESVGALARRYRLNLLLCDWEFSAQDTCTANELSRQHRLSVVFWSPSSRVTLSIRSRMVR